ncbi:MAG: hypothetical protein CMH64_01215 [Nanoarchaeota archaeon]|nr:hypothetical protein [Nanoarchaeota archaeon]|tara:strand:+ start:773 stop:1066 length:294 start_codon:yes stop_codon:yes gene_type:complete
MNKYKAYELNGEETRRFYEEIEKHRWSEVSATYSQEGHNDTVYYTYITEECEDKMPHEDDKMLCISQRGAVINKKDPKGVILIPLDKKVEKLIKKIT